MNKSGKSANCPYDGKPCAKASTCTFRILEVCAVCHETFMARHFSTIGSCAACRDFRRRRFDKNNPKAYASCTQHFLCFMRDGEEIERRMAEAKKRKLESNLNQT